ncbi:MAG: aldehyde dehydrogenase family protein [Planctomycetota bacterium]
MTRHATLTHDASDLVAGQWRPIPGEALVSHNPAHPDQMVFACSPKLAHVDEALAAARAALPAWRAMGLDGRARVLRTYQKLASERVDAMAELIRHETGKVHWDSKAEAGLLAGKVGITLDDSPGAGRTRVAGFDIELTETRVGRCRFRPHGVMGVVGPFNFPAHLPNGHMVPALLMGNTIVLKPSDKTPAVGQALAELFDEALRAEGAPEGVVNLVHGAADVAVKLVTHDELDGILFTGSWPVGRRILESNLDRPGRIVALEMGGNNPAVVMPDADLRQAAVEVARGAFVTTGQRCTCTRRLIVHESIADGFIAAVAKIASNLVVGPPDAEHPVFMGPLVTAEARDAVLREQARQAERGGEIVLAASSPEIPGGGHYVTPGITRVDRFYADDRDDAGCDTETFGPLLRVCAVPDLDTAIQQANATRFGLAASIFTKDSTSIDRFCDEARAGCVNVNAATAGASGKLPFGGLGFSGNHRPAGSFSLDYCAYPVASMIESGDAAAIPPGFTFEDSWLG